MDTRYVNLRSHAEISPDVVRRLFRNPPETFDSSRFCEQCKSFKLDLEGGDFSDDSDGSFTETAGLQGILVPRALSLDCGLCIMMRLIDHTTTSYALRLNVKALPSVDLKPRLWDLHIVNSVFPRHGVFSLRGARLDYSPQRHMLSWDSFLAWPINPLHIDYRALQNNFLHCLQNHRDTCGSVDRIFVPGLRVIHCDSRRIVDATTHTVYAALSYVWGPSSPTTVHAISNARLNRLLPEKVERTIEDALVVTKKLGIQYLWIDRFCIDETGTHKHTQIQQMHSIYQSAELTIIAAAGEDPTYGLPGVSSTPRRRPPACLFGNYLLFNSMKTQEEVLEQSKWNSRAWTYQESRFSRRRLVFTDQEASFSCCVLSIEECSESNGRPTKRKPAPRVRGRASPSPAAPHPSHATGVFPSDVGRRIVEYSGRELTYPSDVIRAFSGILQAFPSSRRSEKWSIRSGAGN